MTERDALRDVSLVLAIAAAIGGVLLWFDRSELMFTVGLPASLIGVIALIVTLARGASRWWLLMFPAIAVPLLVVGLLLLACFQGDCV
ncbi:MAG: hypothetical protein GC147_08360 [Porphyrobacter sp.]|nr:hypothetical protein [Porphyrobacter sp.]